MKRVVGIVPQAKLFEGDGPYSDTYVFVNSYIRRVAENGGTPIGIVSVDGRVQTDALALCDAFLLCGGRKIWPYHMEVLEHARILGKRALGICLGMQAMNAYAAVLAQTRVRDTHTCDTHFCDTHPCDTQRLLDVFADMKRENFLFNRPVAHHWDVPLNYDSIPRAKHAVYIEEGTHLYALLGRRQLEAVTLHNYQINGPAPGVIVSARALDNTIEAIEYGENMLGVQFHPELECEMEPLFQFLTQA